MEANGPAVARPVGDKGIGQQPRWATLTPWLLLAPALLFLVAFFLAPVLFVLFYSLQPPAAASKAQLDLSTLTLSNYLSVLTDDYYYKVMSRTFQTSAAVTAICLVTGFPVAYYLVRSKTRLKPLLIALMLAPLLIDVVIRSFGWVVLLADNYGVVNTLLRAAGVTGEPVHLLGNFPGVVIALVQIFYPFMVLPIVSALDRVDLSIEEAGQTLGAGPWTVMREIVVPLAMPGIASGVLVVFTLTMGALVTPIMIGGARFQVMAVVIYDYVVSLGNWAVGMTLGTIFLVLTLLLAMVYEWFYRRWWIEERT